MYAACQAKGGFTMDNDKNPVWSDAPKNNAPGQPQYGRGPPPRPDRDPDAKLEIEPPPIVELPGDDEDKRSEDEDIVKKKLDDDTRRFTIRDFKELGSKFATENP